MTAFTGYLHQDNAWFIVPVAIVPGAALTVLLMCLQANQFFPGMMIVLAFCVGLALTRVALGAVAAVSARVATKRFKGFDKIVRKMPYASSALMALIGLVVAVQGLEAISQ